MKHPNRHYPKLHEAGRGLSDAKTDLIIVGREKAAALSSLSRLQGEYSKEEAASDSYKKGLIEVRAKMSAEQSIVDRLVDQLSVKKSEASERLKEAKIQFTADKNRMEYLNQKIEESYRLKQELVDVEESFTKLSDYAALPCVGGRAIDPKDIEKEELDIVGDILALSDYL